MSVMQWPSCSVTSIGHSRNPSCDHLNPFISRAHRYLQDPPSMVRLRLSRDQSVVGVNCERLVDTDAFARRKNRVACGLCQGCDRTEECGECGPCKDDGNERRRRCNAKRCLNLIPLYALKNGHHCDLVTSERDSVKQEFVEDDENTVEISVDQVKRDPDWNRT